VKYINGNKGSEESLVGENVDSILNAFYRCRCSYTFGEIANVQYHVLRALVNIKLSRVRPGRKS
jgi:hypothetical protein